MNRKNQTRYTKDQLELAIKTSTTLSNVCKLLHIKHSTGNYRTIKKWSHIWNIDLTHIQEQKPNGYIVSDIELIEAVKVSKSFRSLCNNIKSNGGAATPITLRDRIEKLNINIDHFSEKHLWKPAAPLSELLTEHSFTPTGRLKPRLIKEGLLKEICSICGIGNIWNNKPLVLQLDHINGMPTDNRLENLRLLCPNCHTQTETFGNRSKSIPPKEEVLEILQKIKKSSMLVIARELNKKPTTIRKWLKTYNVCEEYDNYVKHKERVRYSYDKIVEVNNYAILFSIDAACKKYKISPKTLKKKMKFYKL